MNALFGGVHSTFPEDRALQDALVPDLPTRRAATVADEEDDDPTPNDAETEG